jgi:hypothetical protein
VIDRGSRYLVIFQVGGFSSLLAAGKESLLDDTTTDLLFRALPSVVDIDYVGALL